MPNPLTPNHPFYQLQQQGVTSDHLPQDIQVTEYLSKSTPESASSNSDNPSIYGKTWNMLNICHSKTKKRNSFSNNPWNISESPEDFQKRRKLQYDYLLQELKQADPFTFDFMFLQESTELYNHLANQHEQLPSLTIAHKKHLESFCQEVEKLGFRFVITRNEQDNKKLVTIINAKNLTIHPKEVGAEDDTKPRDGTIIGDSIFPNKGKHITNTGLAIDVTHTKTNKKVELVNLHLSYNQPHYRQSLSERQTTNAENDKLTIMGGDTNHVWTSFTRAFVNHNYASNFDDASTNNTQTMDTKHKITEGEKEHDKNFLSTEHYANKQKAYDAFFIFPSSSDHSIEAKELPGNYFALNDKQEIEVKEKTHLLTKTINLFPRLYYVAKLSLMPLSNLNVAFRNKWFRTFADLNNTAETPPNKWEKNLQGTIQVPINGDPKNAKKINYKFTDQAKASLENRGYSSMQIKDKGLECQLDFFQENGHTILGTIKHNYLPTRSTTTPNEASQEEISMSCNVAKQSNYQLGEVQQELFLIFLIKESTNLANQLQCQSNNPTDRDATLKLSIDVQFFSPEDLIKFLTKVENHNKNHPPILAVFNIPQDINQCLYTNQDGQTMHYTAEEYQQIKGMIEKINSTVHSSARAPQESKGSVDDSVPPTSTPTSTRRKTRK